MSQAERDTALAELEQLLESLPPAEREARRKRMIELLQSGSRVPMTLDQPDAAERLREVLALNKR
jgi:hypothetical protein